MRAPLLAALLAAQPAQAAVPAPAPPPLVDLAAERAVIARYQDIDQRLQDVGWRLAAANAPFCSRVVPSIGLQLQDMASYGDPAIARAALGLEGNFAVQTAARGSPAALSGAFVRNREVARLARSDPNGWPTTRPMDWERLARVHRHVEAMLTEHGGIAIAFADGGEARVMPVPVCATRFEVMGEGGKALADGTRVVIGVLSPNFTYDEPILASAVAHELAHNVLGHHAWLDRFGRTAKHVRRLEREADRLIPWLIANAGYDPDAAVTFMRQWGSQNDAGLKLRRTHDGWDERAEMIAAEVPLVRAALGREGKADWSAHFRREINVP
jgi:hypothetical protein